MRSLALVLALPLAMGAALGVTGCRTVRTTDDAPGASKATESSHAVGSDPGGVGRGTKLVPKEGHQLAAFAAGCFWGVEDAFRHVRGVTATAVGYTGGHTDDPDYDAVCTHTTGHAETVLVEFDPKLTSYAHLVKVFFEIHDPTQLNRQGPDEGDQYRSEIFTFDDAQSKAAHLAWNTYNDQRGGKVVTKIEPIPRFWKAEDYHQQYAEKTGSHGCPTKIPDEST